MPLETTTGDALCQCGCGKPAPIPLFNRRRVGWVAGEPRPFCRGHASRRPGPDYELRDTGYETPCWLWLKAVSAKGYGRLVVDGKKRQAHVVYYERVHGPVPEGLQLDHLCRERACVNPDHLDAVTGAENTRRGVNTKLTVEQVRAIRASGRTHQELAAIYGVCQATIGFIKIRRTWKDV